MNIDALLDQMTLEEKIGQITQVEKGSISPDEVARYGIGSVLSGGGGNPDPNDPDAWRAMVDEFVAASRDSRLGIPILYGTDAVHGHNNVVGATIFPHNIGLGAIGDPQLVERVAAATALEVAATGARWTFAPSVCVPQDPRWGRTYEGFGDDPGLVSELGAAAVRGLQGPGNDIHVLACAKHFVGDGGTIWGTTRAAAWVPWWARTEEAEGWAIDQGDAVMDEATLRRVHLPPYRAAVDAGVGTVMASYSSWNGEKVHAHRWLLTDLLKGELGFEGFVVSDWVAVDQVDRDYRRAVVRCLDAGVDMVMVPFDHGRFRLAVGDAVREGELPAARLDDAVRRILRVKQRVGLFGTSSAPLPDTNVVGSAAHRALAREAAGLSATILKDDDGVLPLRPGARVLVAGAAADDVGLCCGGWTIEWQGGAGAITPGATLLDGLRDHLGDAVTILGRPAGDQTADVGIVTVHEPPYAEGVGDRATLHLDDEQLALVRTVRHLVDRLVLVVVSGRPLALDDLEDVADAVVAAWLPGSESAGVADALVGATSPCGQLRFDWPRSDASRLRAPNDASGPTPAPA